MDKNEILEKSKKENGNMDELEKYSLMRAGKWAVAVGGILCVAIFCVEQFAFDTVRLDLWAIFLTICGVNLTVKYYYRKKAHELVFGIIELLIAVALLVIHFMRFAV